MQQVEELLSPQEKIVLAALQQGKAPADIAQELGISRNTIKQVKYRIKQKLGADFVDRLAHQNAPGVKSAQNQITSVADLEKILSPAELKILLLYKSGLRAQAEIAQYAGASVETVGKAMWRLKNKLKGQYDKLISEQRLEGLELPTPKAERECRSCTCFIYAVCRGSQKEICCRRHGLIKLDQTNCADYTSRYISHKRDKKMTDQQLLLERLLDKNYVRMAFKLGFEGYEPKNGVEKSQYAINGLGYRDYHFKRRAQAFKALAKSARYILVRIEAEDRRRPAVKRVLEQFSLSPVKVDFDQDEKGRWYSTAYFALENNLQYQELMTALEEDE